MFMNLGLCESELVAEKFKHRSPSLQIDSYLLVMVVELSYLGGNLADLPSFQVIFRVQNVPVLLLKSPQPRVGIESSLKMSLPPFMADLRQISSCW
jgi:hypothetical protein